MPKRRIELCGDQGELRLKFPYDSTLISLVRSLPERRYSPEDKNWYVPVGFVGVVLEKLSAWEFEVPAEVRAAAARGSARAQDKPSLTPSALNARVNQALRKAFPRDVWIVAEVSGWRPSNGRCFFELVERDPRGGPAALAKVRAVVFAAELAAIEAAMAQMSPPLEMVDGLKVRVRGRVELYQRSGAFQMRVREIDPFYTVSAMAQEREKVLRRLEEMDLAGRNLALSMPAVPLRVGLITSVGSDAYMDFIQELTQSGRGFDVSVFDARMQGVHLEATVLEALSFFRAKRHSLDVVVIVRGGGSRTELGHFDTLPIGEAVCTLGIPLVCGIGHQLDRCLIDEIARSFKTPTAAASALVELVNGFVSELDSLHRRVGELCMRQVDEEREEVAFLEERVGREASQRVRARRIVLRGLGADLRRWGGSRVETERRNLDTVQRELNGSVSRRLSLLKREVEAATSPLAGGRLSRQLAHRRDVLDDVSRRLLGAMERRLRDDPEVEGMRGRLAASTKRLERQRHELDGLRGRLGGAVSRQLARQRELVDSLESRRNGLDPMRVLERGFALVTDASGALVRDAGRVARGEQLRVRLASGELSARRIDDPVENVEGGE